MTKSTEFMAALMVAHREGRWKLTERRFLEIEKELDKRGVPAYAIIVYQERRFRCR